jgi:hypothetical protein
MRIAIDTNVLLDLADGRDDVVDALQTIRSRLKNAQLIITSTVIEELSFALDEGGEKSRLAQIALENVIAWGIQPADMLAIGHGICDTIGLKLRLAGYLPEHEVNDGLIIAEAAMWGSAMLLSSDLHLLEAGRDPERKLWRVLDECHAASTRMVIAKPREIARKFFR